MKTATIGLNCLFSGALLALVACNSSSSAIKSAESSKKNGDTTQLASAEGSNIAEAAKEEPTELANVVNKANKVNTRGAFIRILVNKTPITNFDIKRRVNFLKLRRTKGDLTSIAEKEMVDQTLKLTEARGRNTAATEAQVEASFANFAKQNRTTPAVLTRELGKRGVSASHFKDFIRTQISWQRTVQGRFQVETTQLSEQQAIQELKKSGNVKPKVAEYTFKQIIFVVPKNKRNQTTLAARTREANAFKQSLSGCENTLEAIKGLRDVSLIDRRHIMEPELPQRWKDDIVKVGAAGTTDVKETERGIEFMTVCNSRMMDDDRAAQISKQSTDFGSFNEQSDELSEKYLSELRSRSKIVYQ